MQIQNISIIKSSDWDDLVRKTYGKPYDFQQQDDCQDRGVFKLTIPSKYTNEGEMHESIPETINGNEMGVKFETWLSRDAEKSVNGKSNDWEINMFWERNFYPDIYTLANDLHKKGLLEAGEYGIDIDW